MSRDYAQVWPGFWTGETGRVLSALASQGDANPQRVAMYVMTCASATFTGMFYLPLPLLVHELGGIDLEGARKALQTLSDCYFARYHEPLAQCWVLNACRFNVGERLSLRDNRLVALRRELDSQRKSPFYRDFCEHYAALLSPPEQDPSATPPRPLHKPLRSPSEGARGSGAVARAGARSRAGENARTRAAPPPPMRIAPAESGAPLTAAELGQLFDAAWRSFGNAAPPLPAVALGELAERITATAADRGEDPRALLERALTAWGKTPRNPRELRGPVECFARDFGELVAKLDAPAQAAQRDLVAERDQAMRDGDNERCEELNAELRALNGGERHAHAR